MARKTWMYYSIFGMIAGISAGSFLAFLVLTPQIPCITEKTAVSISFIQRVYAQERCEELSPEELQKAKDDALRKAQKQARAQAEFAARAPNDAIRSATRGQFIPGSLRVSNPVVYWAAKAADTLLFVGLLVGLGGVSYLIGSIVLAAGVIPMAIASLVAFLFSIPVFTSFTGIYRGTPTLRGIADSVVALYRYHTSVERIADAYVYRSNYASNTINSSQNGPLSAQPIALPTETDSALERAQKLYTKFFHGDATSEEIGQALKEEQQLTETFDAADVLNPEKLITETFFYGLKKLYADQSRHGRRLRQMFDIVKGSFHAVTGVKNGKLHTRTQAMLELLSQVQDVDKYGQATALLVEPNITKPQANMAIRMATKLAVLYRDTGLYANIITKKASDGEETSVIFDRFDRPNDVGAAERSRAILAFALSTEEGRAAVQELVLHDEKLTTTITPELWQLIESIALEDINYTRYNQYDTKVEVPVVTTLTAALDFAATLRYPSMQLFSGLKQNPTFSYIFEQFWEQEEEGVLSEPFDVSSINNNFDTTNDFFESAAGKAFISVMPDPTSFEQTVVNYAVSRIQTLSDAVNEVLGGDVATGKEVIEDSDDFLVVLETVADTYPPSANTKESVTLAKSFVEQPGLSHLPKSLLTLLQKLLVADPGHAQNHLLDLVWSSLDFAASGISRADAEALRTLANKNASPHAMLANFTQYIYFNILGYQVVGRYDFTSLDASNRTGLNMIGGDLLLRVGSRSMEAALQAMGETCKGCVIVRAGISGDEYLILAPKNRQLVTVPNIVDGKEQGTKQISLSEHIKNQVFNTDKDGKPITEEYDKKDPRYFQAPEQWVYANGKKLELKPVRIKYTEVPFYSERLFAENETDPSHTLPNVTEETWQEFKRRGYPMSTETIARIDADEKLLQERGELRGHMDAEAIRQSKQILVAAYSDNLTDKVIRELGFGVDDPHIISTRSIDIFQRRMATLKTGEILMFRRGLEIYIAIPGSGNSVNVILVDVPGVLKGLQDEAGYAAGDQLISLVLRTTLAELKGKIQLSSQGDVDMVTRNIRTALEIHPQVTIGGKNIVLHAGVSYDHALTRRSWVALRIDALKSKVADNHIENLRNRWNVALQNSEIAEYIHTYFADVKRGLARLIRLLPGGNDADEVFALASSDRASFLTRVRDAMNTYAVGKSEVPLLAETLAHAKKKVTGYVVGDMPNYPGREFYVGFPVQDIHFALENQAIPLAVVAPGARMVLRVDDDPTTDLEYEKLPNGTWVIQSAQERSLGYREITEEDIAIFAPDTGSGFGFMSRIDAALRPILIYFGADARVLPGGLNIQAAKGLAFAYEWGKELGCKATVACNTISLLDKAAQTLLRWGEGNALFTLTIPEIMSYARSHDVIVLGTDIFMNSLRFDAETPLRTYLDLHSNDAEVRSLVQEIIWRQKAAIDHVYVPPELYREIKYLNNPYYLQVKVRELVEILKRDNIQVVLGCTELPDAFRFAAKRFPKEVGEYLNNPDPEKRPIDPAVLVNDALLTRAGLKSASDTNDTSAEQPSNTDKITPLPLPAIHQLPTQNTSDEQPPKIYQTINGDEMVVRKIERIGNTLIGTGAIRYTSSAKQDQFGVTETPIRIMFNLGSDAVADLPATFDAMYLAATDVLIGWHGYMESGEQYVPAVESMLQPWDAKESGKKQMMIAISHSGTEGTARYTKKYSPDALVAQVKDAIDYLSAQGNLADPDVKVVLMGHSLGGWIVNRLALLYSHEKGTVFAKAKYVGLSPFLGIRDQLTLLNQYQLIPPLKASGVLRVVNWPMWRRMPGVRTFLLRVFASLGFNDELFRSIVSQNDPDVVTDHAIDVSHRIPIEQIFDTELSIRMTDTLLNAQEIVDDSARTLRYLSVAGRLVWVYPGVDDALDSEITSKKAEEIGIRVVGFTKGHNPSLESWGGNIHDVIQQLFADQTPAEDFTVPAVNRNSMYPTVDKNRKHSFRQTLLDGWKRMRAQKNESKQTDENVPDASPSQILTPLPTAPRSGVNTTFVQMAKADFIKNTNLYTLGDAFRYSLGYPAQSPIGSLLRNILSNSRSSPVKDMLELFYSRLLDTDQLYDLPEAPEMPAKGLQRMIIEQTKKNSAFRLVWNIQAWSVMKRLGGRVVGTVTLPQLDAYPDAGAGSKAVLAKYARASFYDHTRLGIDVPFSKFELIKIDANRYAVVAFGEETFESLQTIMERSIPAVIEGATTTTPDPTRLHVVYQPAVDGDVFEQAEGGKSLSNTEPLRMPSGADLTKILGRHPTLNRIWKNLDSLDDPMIIQARPALRQLLMSLALDNALEAEALSIDAKLKVKLSDASLHLHANKEDMLADAKERFGNSFTVLRIDESAALRVAQQKGGNALKAKTNVELFQRLAGYLFDDLRVKNIIIYHPTETEYYVVLGPSPFNVKKAQEALTASFEKKPYTVNGRDQIFLMPAIAAQIVDVSDGTTTISERFEQVRADLKQAVELHMRQQIRALFSTLSLTGNDEKWEWLLYYLTDNPSRIVRMGSQALISRNMPIQLRAPVLKAIAATPETDHDRLLDEDIKAAEINNWSAKYQFDHYYPGAGNPVEKQVVHGIESTLLAARKEKVDLRPDGTPRGSFETQMTTTPKEKDRIVAQAAAAVVPDDLQGEVSQIRVLAHHVAFALTDTSYENQPMDVSLKQHSSLPWEVVKESGEIRVGIYNAGTKRWKVFTLSAEQRSAIQAENADLASMEAEIYRQFTASGEESAETPHHLIAAFYLQDQDNRINLTQAPEVFVPEAGAPVVYGFDDKGHPMVANDHLAFDGYLSVRFLQEFTKVLGVKPTLEELAKMEKIVHPTDHKMDIVLTRLPDGTTYDQALEAYRRAVKRQGKLGIETTVVTGSLKSRVAIAILSTLKPFTPAYVNTVIDSTRRGFGLLDRTAFVLFRRLPLRIVWILQWLMNLPGLNTFQDMLRGPLLTWIADSWDGGVPPVLTTVIAATDRRTPVAAFMVDKEGVAVISWQGIADEVVRNEVIRDFRDQLRAIQRHDTAMVEPKMKSWWTRTILEPFALWRRSRDKNSFSYQPFPVIEPIANRASVPLNDLTDWQPDANTKSTVLLSDNQTTFVVQNYKKNDETILVLDVGSPRLEQTLVRVNGVPVKGRVQIRVGDSIDIRRFGTFRVGVREDRSHPIGLVNVSIEAVGNTAFSSVYPNTAFNMTQAWLGTDASGMTTDGNWFNDVKRTAVLVMGEGSEILDRLDAWMIKLGTNTSTQSFAVKVNGKNIPIKTMHLPGEQTPISYDLLTPDIAYEIIDTITGELVGYMTIRGRYLEVELFIDIAQSQQNVDTQPTPLPTPGPGVVIGTKPDGENQFVVPARSKFSQFDIDHARIYPDGNGLSLMNFSKKGTWVNGVLIGVGEHVGIAFGDEVIFGQNPSDPEEDEIWRYRVDMDAAGNVVLIRFSPASSDATADIPLPVAFPEGAKENPAKKSAILAPTDSFRLAAIAELPWQSDERIVLEYQSASDEWGTLSVRATASVSDILVRIPLSTHMRLLKKVSGGYVQIGVIERMPTGWIKVFGTESGVPAVLESDIPEPAAIAAEKAEERVQALRFGNNTKQPYPEYTEVQRMLAEALGIDASFIVVQPINNTNYAISIDAPSLIFSGNVMERERGIRFFHIDTITIPAAFRKNGETARRYSSIEASMRSIFGVDRAEAVGQPTTDAARAFWKSVGFVPETNGVLNTTYKKDYRPSQSAVYAFDQSFVWFMEMMKKIQEFIRANVDRSTGDSNADGKNPLSLVEVVQNPDCFSANPFVKRVYATGGKGNTCSVLLRAPRILLNELRQKPELVPLLYSTVQYAPIHKGEHFVIQEWMQRIEQADPNSVERSILQAAFNQKFAYYQAGEAKLKVEIRELMIEHPESTDADVEKIYAKYQQQYGFAQDVYTIILNAVRRFRTEHSITAAALKNLPNGQILIAKALGVDVPSNAKMMVQGPFVVVELDEKDFDRASKRADALARNIDTSEESFIESIGIQIPTTRIPELNEKVMLINRKFSRTVRSVYTEHEMQHAVYDMFSEDDGVETKRLSALLKEWDSSGEREQGLIAYMQNVQFEYNVSTEILAYATNADETADGVISNLTKRESEDGAYDYYAQRARSVRRIVLREYGDSYAPTIDKLLAEYLGTPEQYARHNAMVTSGVQAAFQVKTDRNGIRRDAAIALFMNEPIVRWPMIAQGVRVLKTYDGLIAIVKSAVAQAGNRDCYTENPFVERVYAQGRDSSGNTCWAGFRAPWKVINELIRKMFQKMKQEVVHDAVEDLKQVRVDTATVPSTLVYEKGMKIIPLDTTYYKTYSVEYPDGRKYVIKATGSSKWHELYTKYFSAYVLPYSEVTLDEQIRHEIIETYQDKVDVASINNWSIQPNVQGRHLSEVLRGILQGGNVYDASLLQSVYKFLLQVLHAYTEGFKIDAPMKFYVTPQRNEANIILTTDNSIIIVDTNNGAIRDGSKASVYSGSLSQGIMFSSFYDSDIKELLSKIDQVDPTVGQSVARQNISQIVTPQIIMNAREQALRIDASLEGERLVNAMIPLVEQMQEYQVLVERIPDGITREQFLEILRPTLRQKVQAFITAQSSNTIFSNMTAFLNQSKARVSAFIADTPLQGTWMLLMMYAFG